MSGKTWLYIKRGVGILLLIGMTLALFGVTDDLISREDAMGQRNAMEVAADVLFLGSSHVHCGVIPQQLMDDYGIAALNESTTSMMPQDSLLLLKLDIQKYHPSVVVVDLFSFLSPYTYDSIINSIGHMNSQTMIYYQKTTEGMSWFDPEKYLILAEHEKNEPGSLPYGLPTYSSHKSLLDGRLDKINPKRNRPYASRFNYMCQTGTAKSMQLDLYTDEELEQVQIFEPFVDILDEMMELSEKGDCALIFSLVPFYMNRAEEKVFELIQAYLDERGAVVLDAQTISAEAALDKTVDLCDIGHLGYNGAHKVTGVYGAYLDQNYDLPDRRLDDDPKYDPWKRRPYSYLADFAASQLRATTDFETYVRYLADLNEDYTVMIAADGNEAFWQDPANAEIWSRWSDIDPEVVFAEDEGYMALLNGTEIHHQESYSGEFLYLDYER